MGPALFGWPWRHVESVAGGCAMRSSQSVGQSARSSPDNRHPGSVGGRGVPRPSPLFSPATWPLKSERPPLSSLISHSRSWTTNKRYSSRCSRGSGRSVGRQQHRVQGAGCKNDDGGPKRGVPGAHRPQLKYSAGGHGNMSCTRYAPGSIRSSPIGTLAEQRVGEPQRQESF